MSVFSAAIIGLGQIGLEYDYQATDDQVMVTHASGFAGHSGFALAGGVDSDPVQRERFERKYGCPAYATLDQLLAHVSPEVFSLAVPTALHHRAFTELLEAGPRGILCEKPIASTVADAEEMLALARSRGCAVLVNYMRRFEPGVLLLREAIRRGDFGEIYKGSVWYSKGFLNNGSHFIDLLRFLLGEVSDFHLVSAGAGAIPGDPEPDVMLRFGAAEIYFLSGRESCFSLAEVELVGTKGRLLYAGGGASIECRFREPDPDYPGYFGLGAAQRIPSDLPRYQWHVLEALHGHLCQGTPLNSDAASALETLKVVERIVTALP